METQYDPARSVAIKRRAAHFGSPPLTNIKSAIRRRSGFSFASFRERVSGPLVGHVTPTAPPISSADQQLTTPVFVNIGACGLENHA